MIKTCRWCGKEFDDTNTHGGRPQKYCNDRCRDRYYKSKRVRQTEHKIPRRKTPRLKKSKTKPNYKSPQLDIDIHIMAVCGIQYGQLQVLRRQNLTDAEITERYSPKRKKEELRCT